MAVRSSMAALIARIRTLINDPSGVSQIFDDQTIQDVCDESRLDVVNMRLIPTPTYGPALQYLNFYSEVGGWETDFVILQNLSTTVTPSSAEPIAGKFTFATNTYPTLTITGKQHDLYRAAADLLERLAAKYALQFSLSSDGQSFHPEQIQDNIDKLVRKYRMKQRPRTITMTRSDLSSGQRVDPTAPTWGDRTGLGGH